MVTLLDVVVEFWCNKIKFSFDDMQNILLFQYLHLLAAKYVSYLHCGQQIASAGVNYGAREDYRAVVWSLGIVSVNS